MNIFILHYKRIQSSIGWKQLTVANTLVHYNLAKITAVKSLMVQAPRSWQKLNCFKPFLQCTRCVRCTEWWATSVSLPVKDLDQLAGASSEDSSDGTLESGNHHPRAPEPHQSGSCEKAQQGWDLSTQTYDRLTEQGQPNTWCMLHLGLKSQSVCPW